MNIKFKVPQKLLDAGFPTFEQFCKDPDKYKGKTDELLGQVDAGGQSLKQVMKKMKYSILGYEAKSLVEVEKIAKDHGYGVSDFELKPQLLPRAGHTCDVRVEFVLKSGVMPS